VQIIYSKIYSSASLNVDSATYFIHVHCHKLYSLFYTINVRIMLINKIQSKVY